MPRSEYPGWNPCKTCGRFPKCVSKKTKVASCDKYHQATEEEMKQDEESLISVRVVMK